MKKLQLFSLLLMLACFVPQAARAEYYGIKVAGVSVTSDNCNNITGSRIFTHENYIFDNNYFTFDSYYSKISYDPSTKTLTLRNIKIDCKNNEYAIYNESCDGLTIVFEDYNKIRSDYASALRLNANTTIKSASGIIGGSKLYTEIKGDEKDAITIFNGARLVISDIQMKISAFVTPYDASTAIVSKSGREEVVITDAYVDIEGKKALSDLSLFVVQNSGVKLSTRTFAQSVATGLKDVRILGTEKMKDANDQEVYFSQTDGTFLLRAAGSAVTDMSILTYTPINEETFPDEAFRGLVTSSFDKNSDSELDFEEVLNAENLYADNMGISSLQGINQLQYLKKVYCRNNKLTYLDVSSMEHLLQLDCRMNQITYLKLTNCQHLISLYCSGNRIPFIDFTDCQSLINADISGNIIDAWMTETLESLHEVSPYKNAQITVMGQDLTTDNVCTLAQAQIAKDKGWNVILGNIDDEGNVVYNIQIAGKHITSANANDLTVLPGVTKNTDWGYARYDISKQTLCLSGVDIVSETGNAIDFRIKDSNPIIELGEDLVNIIGAEDGIATDSNTVKSLTITTAEAEWYKQKLNVSANKNPIALLGGDLVLNGAARVEAKSTTYSEAYCAYVSGNLYVKGEAELRIGKHAGKPLYAEALVLEDDNIIVAPKGIIFSNNMHCFKTDTGIIIKGAEIVIGKLRNYNYYVAGTQFTNANQHDVLGDGTIVFQEPAYDSGPGTLVLTNANIEAGSEAGINAGKTLYIKLEGENTINSTTYGIASKYCYIQGPGSLYVNGKYGIDAHLSKLFISDGAQVTAEGSTQYAINGQETTISGENTVVRMKCGPDARGTFKASTSLTLNDGLRIETPAGAQYVDGEIKDADGNVIKDEWVTIQYTEDYGITVAGIKVTNRNMTDVLGDGTVSYNPETLTLTLTDANIDGGDGSGIEAEQELHIKLEGSNTITCTRSLNGTSKGIWFKGKGFIEGPGSLSITAMYGIYAIGNNQPKPLQILDGAQVSAEGDLRGIMAGITTISGEETVVKAKGGDGSFGCTALNLNDQLEITQPAGASFNLSKLAICAGRRNDIVTSWVTIQKVNKYNIYVAGTQVTSLNQADVLGDGTVSYDAETNTLTLNNANIETEGEGLSTQIDEVIIKLEGENKITSEGSGIMGQTLNIEATTDDSYGPGTLDIIASYTGIRATSSLNVCGGAHVTAESTGSCAILTQFLTVSGAETVLGMKGEEGTYSGFAPELEDGLELTQPVGAYYNEDTGNIVNAEGEAIKGEWVVIGAPVSVESYEIFIAGTQVTSLNQADVLGDGTVSYDAETNTLTLNNANIETEGEGLSTQIDEVIIKLEGENSIEVPEGFGIYSDASFTITGPGSLSVTSKFEALNGSFVIEGGAKVTADSQTRSALWSFYPLAVSGSETVVMLKGAMGAVEIYGADSEEAVLSLSDGLVLGLPEGAHCGIVDVLVEEEEDMWIPYGYILDANDNNITDEWIIIASEDYITGINDLKDSKNLKDLNDSTYNLAGQKVGKDYKGIVIQGGRKLLKK